MPALLALRLATYLMVCTGVAALYFANLIGASGRRAGGPGDPGELGPRAGARARRGAARPRVEPGRRRGGGDRGRPLLPGLLAAGRHGAPAPVPHPAAALRAARAAGPARRRPAVLLHAGGRRLDQLQPQLPGRVHRVSPARHLDADPQPRGDRAGAGGLARRRGQHRAPGLLPRAAHPGEPGRRRDHARARGRPLLRDPAGGAGRAAAPGVHRAHGDRVLGPRGPGQLRRHRERPHRGHARLPGGRVARSGHAARAPLARGGVRPVRRPDVVERGGAPAVPAPVGHGRLRARAAPRDGPDGAPGDLPRAHRERRGVRGAARGAARDPLAHPGGGRHGRPHRVEPQRAPALRRRVRDRQPGPAGRSRAAARRPP